MSSANILHVENSDEKLGENSNEICLEFPQLDIAYQGPRNGFQLTGGKSEREGWNFLK